MIRSHDDYDKVDAETMKAILSIIQNQADHEAAKAFVSKLVQSNRLPTVHAW